MNKANFNKRHKTVAQFGLTANPLPDASNTHLYNATRYHKRQEAVRTRRRRRKAPVLERNFRDILHGEKHQEKGGDIGFGWPE